MIICVIKIFFVQFFVYSCHLFLISSASVRFIPFLSFIVPSFAWNIPLVSLIFLKKSQVFPILLFSSISLLKYTIKCCQLYALSPTVDLQNLIILQIKALYLLITTSKFTKSCPSLSGHRETILHRLIILPVCARSCPFLCTHGL